MTNKEIVLKFIDEVFNGGDLSKIDQYMREDYRQHSPEVADGREGFRAFAKGFCAQKPFMDIVKIGQDEDMVYVFFKCHIGENTHKVVDIYRLKDGLLAEHWDCIMPCVKDEDCVNGNGHF